MTGKSVLPLELRPFEYYLHKLPLYLQNDNNFIEHFRIWYELLIGGEVLCSDLTLASDSLLVSSGSSVVYVIDTLFELLNVFDLNCQVVHTNATDANEHYLSILNSLPNSNDGKSSDILDKIAALFGLKRNFSVVVSGEEYQLTLNNRDFLILIKCTIVRNWFDGSYIDLRRLYDAVGLNVFIFTDAAYPAECDIRMLNVEASEFSVSDNVKKLFLAGLLTVESVGITYKYLIYDNTTAAIFDSTVEANTFDYGKFVA